MLIYVNGDSFSSGAGSLDYKLVPNYEKLKKETDFSKFSEVLTYIDKARKQTLKSLLNFELREEEKKLSWPSILSDLTDYDVINSSESGSSMEGIAFRTLFDLSKLKEQNKIPDIVLIQLTHRNRYCLYKFNKLNQENKFGLEYPWIESHLPDWNYDNSPYIKFWVNEHTDNDIILKYIIDLVNLNTYVKLYTDKYPKYVINYPVQTQLTDIKTFYESTEKNFDLDHLIKLSRVFSIDENLFQEKYNLKKEFLPCGHYNQEVNTLFANSVKNLIENKFYDKE
jgi:hypothetical protein